jgi:hypothetical protein
MYASIVPRAPGFEIAMASDWLVGARESELCVIEERCTLKMVHVLC